MNFRILGSLEVSDGLAPVVLGGAKPRALLTMLLLHANEPVSAERLAIALWGEEAPRDLVGTVRVHVSRLRRVLPDPDALVTTPAGYRLTVRPGELDAERFHARLAGGRAALDERRHADAAALLREALDEWRGAALADFALEPFAEDEAARLEDQRLLALEARVEADLALGRHAELGGELRRLADAHPLRERLQAQLMLALYRSDRQADALATYRRARAALVEEAGLEPGAELRELERAILDQSPSLAFAPAPEVDSDDEPARPPALPDPVAREVGRRGALVGRADVLARLRERWVLARGGERQFVLVAGEPGIGKTRLASEFGRAMHSEGALVLYGRSDAESITPYQPFIAALDQHLAGSGEAIALPAGFEPELRELARFLPALRPHVGAAPEPDGDQQIRRFRLHAAVARVLAFAARAQPMLLLLDDLHWADTATALLLGHVLSDGEAAPLLVLGMVRDAGEPRTDALSELLARSRRQPAFERIELRGLDASETGTLAAQRGHRVAGDAARLLHDRTDGNPLFIGELLRTVAVDEMDLERALVRGGVPDGVKETIGRRLALLGHTASKALDIACVAGRQFDFELVAALHPEPAEAVVAALEEAVAAGLIREVDEEPGRFVFSHALVQETLYERQSALRRRRAHQRIGELLADGGGAPAEIAHHFYLARSTEVLRYEVLAAREATAALAFEEAAAHYRRALDVLAPGDPRARCDLLLALAGVERAAGESGARETFGQAAALARDAGLTERFAQAALGFPYPYAEAGALDAAGAALLEEALAALEERDDPLAVKLLARLANVLYYHVPHERIDALSSAALAMARRVGDPDALVIALESRHTANYHISGLDERLAIADELLALARRTGARAVEGLAQLRRMYDLLEAGDIAGARTAHRELALLAGALRHPLLLHAVACFDVVWAGLESRFEDAHTLAERALLIGERGHAPSAGVEYAAQQLAQLHRAGKLAEHIEAIRAAAEASPHLVIYRSVLCLAHVQAGDAEAGRAQFGALAAHAFAGVPRDILWLGVMCILAEACAQLGDPAGAALLYDQLAPYRHRHVQIGWAAHWGSAERFLGLLATAKGDAGAAAAHFAAAGLSQPAGMSEIER